MILRKWHKGFETLINKEVASPKNLTHSELTLRVNDERRVVQRIRKVGKSVEWNRPRALYRNVFNVYERTLR